MSEARLEQAEALLESFGREIEPCPRGRDLAVAVLETVFDLLVGFAIASKDFPLP